MKKKERKISKVLVKFKFQSRFILYGSKLYIGYTSLLVDLSSRSNIYFDLFAFF